MFYLLTALAALFIGYRLAKFNPMEHLARGINPWGHRDDPK